MTEEFIIMGTAYMLAFMAIYILFEMIRINRIVHIAEIERLMFAPVIISVFYLWIAIFDPEIRLARLWSRFELFAVLSIIIRTLYSYSKKIRKTGRK